MVGAMRKEVMEQRELRKETKLRVFNAMVVPTLNYDCETWAVQKRHESRLQACEMACLRRVAGVMRLDRVGNDDNHEAMGQRGVVDMMKERQRRWKEKLEGMNGGRMVKQVYEGGAVGKRPRGRDGMITLNKHTYIRMYCEELCLLRVISTVLLLTIMCVYNISGYLLHRRIKALLNNNKLCTYCNCSPMCACFSAPTSLVPSPHIRV